MFLTFYFFCIYSLYIYFILPAHVMFINKRFMTLKKFKSFILKSTKLSDILSGIFSLLFTFCPYSLYIYFILPAHVMCINKKLRKWENEAVLWLYKGSFTTPWADGFCWGKHLVNRETKGFIVLHKHFSFFSWAGAKRNPKYICILY